MAKNSLHTLIEAMEVDWGPLSTKLISDARRHMQQLLKAHADENWLAMLYDESPTNKELFRNAKHGYMLLAHTEPTGLYRPPHDHGRGWVIYAIQQGEIEMGTYARIEGANGNPQLVKRNTTLVRAGEVQVYLPGDIHDTRCVNGPALLFRFTERDLRKEDSEEHRVTRYVEQNGVWTVGPA